MAIGGKVKGLEQIKNALAQVKKEHDKKKRQALNRIGVIIKADSVKLTPVDTSNLRGSAYIDVDGTKSVFIGYTASYAVFVHEDLEAIHKVGEAKFLEKAVKMNKQRIIEELAKGGL